MSIRLIVSSVDGTTATGAARLDLHLEEDERRRRTHCNVLLFSFWHSVSKSRCKKDPADYNPLMHVVFGFIYVSSDWMKL